MNKTLTASRFIDDCSAEGVKENVLNKGKEGYFYVACYVKHPECCLDVNELVRVAKEMNGGREDGSYLSNDITSKLLPPMGVPDITLTTKLWNSYVIGRVSPWIDPDSDNSYIRYLSEKALWGELHYFAYLGLTAVVVPLRGLNHGNLARIISQYMEDPFTNKFKVWMDVPLVAPQSIGLINGEDSDADLTNGHNGGGDPSMDIKYIKPSEEEDENQDQPPKLYTRETADPWRWFYEFRTCTNNNPRIGVVLELTPDLPDASIVLERWKGEPLRAIKFNTRTFLTDENGMPILSNAHQQLTKELFALPLQAMVEGPILHTRPPSQEPTPAPITPAPEAAAAASAPSTSTATPTVTPTVTGRSGSKKKKAPVAAVVEPSVPVPNCVYYDHLNLLWKNKSPLDELAEWAHGYEDYLQMPLQPLGDNLESQVYETFEKDPIKYVEYGLAVDMALDIKKQKSNSVLSRIGHSFGGNPRSQASSGGGHRKRPPSHIAVAIRDGVADRLRKPLEPLTQNLKARTYAAFETDEEKYELYTDALDGAISRLLWRDPDALRVLMVLGAGRGPLVTASYQMLKKHQVAFKLYAVEKNQNAVVTLQKKNESEWNNEVVVVHTDMRRFHPEDKADIIVSELLGSFGDNELSPECLDGASHLLKEDCISIPSSYSSYIGPIHSPRLLNEVRSCSQRDRQSVAAYETAYVVRVFNQFEIAPPQHLFQFDHPNFSGGANDRYKELTFVARDTSEVMGFVGYFSAVLFDNVTMSIFPDTYTPGLCSWFPIMFPIQGPVLVKKGERIRLRFWRCSNDRFVWYEWQLVEPKCLPIMNPAGRSYSIRLV